MTPAFPNAAAPPLGTLAPVSSGSLAATVRPPAEPDIWTLRTPGVRPALAFAFLFALLFYRRVSPDDTLTHIVGPLFAAFALRAALSIPRRLPLFLAAYLPFNLAYAFPIAGIPTANMTTFLLALSVVAWLKSRRASRSTARFGPFEVLLLIYAALALLSHLVASAGSGDLVDIVIIYKSWISPVALYFLVRSMLRDRDDLRALLLVIVATATLVSLLCWHDARTGSHLESGRVTGILYQSNTMGAFLVYYGLPLIGISLTTKSLRIRLTALAAFGAIVKGILSTYSRGAYFAALLGLIVQLLFRGPSYLIGVAAVYTPLAMFVQGALPEDAINRVRKTTASNDDSRQSDLSGRPEDDLDDSSRERILVWRAARKMIVAHPFLGVGLGRFRQYVARYHEEGVTLDAHNAYLRLGAELGVPALLCMVLILIWQMVRSLRLYYLVSHPFDRSLCLGFLGTVVGVVISCVFGSRFSDEALIDGFWLLAAMCSVLPAVAIPRAERRLRQQGGPQNA